MSEFRQSFFSQRFPGKVEPSYEAGTEIILQAFQNLDAWRIRSVQAFRNVLLGEGGMMANPIIDFGSNEILEGMILALRRTVKEGRLIDFGHVPNEVIKRESLRAREAFECSELLMPFRDWVGISSWEGGMCGYFFMSPSWAADHIICVELYGLSIPDLGPICKAHDSFIIYDQTVVQIQGPGKTLVKPTHMVDQSLELDTAQMSMRGSNVLDPLVCFLRFINDASCPILRHEAPDKLNKTRTQKGKPAIPAHYEVAAHDYITRLYAEESARRKARGQAASGTHASPMAHWRRAHQRHLRTGEVIDVRASRVNFRSLDDMHRLFYTVKLGGTK